MKLLHYSIREVIKHGNIPNLDPNVWKLNKLSSDFTTGTYELKHVPSGQVLLTFQGYWRSNFSTNQKQIAVGLGLITQDQVEHCSQESLIFKILDNLYFEYNKPTMFKNKAKTLMYVNVERQLIRRMLDADYSSELDFRSKDLLNTYINFKYDNFLRTTTLTGLDLYMAFNSTIPSDLLRYIAKCAITGTTLYKGELWIVNINNHLDVKVNINFRSDYQALGYTKHRSSTLRELYLSPGYFIINGAVMRTVHPESDWRTCTSCNTLIPPEGYEENSTVCNTCESNSYKIHSYSTKAEELLKFKASKVKENNFYLGVELEFETTVLDVAKKKVGRALAGHAIMKSDGSIRNGFEVVTCPATLDIQLEVFSKFYKDFPAELTNASNVGMHVHISRKPLSMLTIGKLTRFMNLPENTTFIKAIGGRKEISSYAKINSSRAENLSYHLVNGAGDRYNVLNLNKPQTIEFRLFSTPLDWHDFAYKVEFVQAIVDYSMPCAVQLNAYEHADHKNFRDFVTKNRKAYPELALKLKSI